METSLVLLFFMAQGYETQSYDVVETINEIEIRYYPPAMKVRVESPYFENRNFKTLFRYISGNNEEKEKIAMTTPVYMKNKSQTQEMEFVLPEKYNNVAPKPKGKGVEVYQSKAGYFAAIRYGGYSKISQEKIFIQELLDELNQAGKKIIGSALLLSYDAPYKFYNRRNEILIEISP
jgi:hypothetical protein